MCVQTELKQRRKESKNSYKKRLEEKLERRKVRDDWSGMRRITGLQRKGGLAAVGNIQ